MPEMPVTSALGSPSRRQESFSATSESFIERLLRILPGKARVQGWSRYGESRINETKRGKDVMRRPREHCISHPGILASKMRNRLKTPDLALFVRHQRP